MLLVLPSNLHSATRSVRFGSAAKTGVASAALTSVGVRGTGQLLSKAHDQGQHRAFAAHRAAGSFKPGSHRSHSPGSVPIQRPAGVHGTAQGATPGYTSGAAEAEYGYRFWLLRAPAASTAKPWLSLRCKRGAGRIQAGAAKVTGHPGLGGTTRPNPSLKWTRNGRPPWPKLRYAVHFLSPGQGVLPSVPPQLKR